MQEKTDYQPLLGLIFITIGIVISLNDCYDKLEKELDYSPPKIQIVRKEVTTQVAIASWYDYQLEGIEWSKTHRTAASRDYPRKSYLKVTNIENNKSVIVFVNDYGPEEWTNRHIDLSSYAFSQIASLTTGLIKVKIEPVN
jgi:rare lipoprotein A (peptidoglycan hydrolase)